MKRATKKRTATNTATRAKKVTRTLSRDAAVRKMRTLQKELRALKEALDRHHLADALIHYACEQFFGAEAEEFYHAVRDRIWGAGVQLPALPVPQDDRDYMQLAEEIWDQLEENNGAAVQS